VPTKRSVEIVEVEAASLLNQRPNYAERKRGREKFSNNVGTTEEKERNETTVRRRNNKGDKEGPPGSGRSREQFRDQDRRWLR